MRKLVTINLIEEIKPIENAEFIESARVKGWWVVVKKNEFKVGDKVVFFEVDSFLPDIEQYSFLKKGNTLKRMLIDGEIKTGIRLRTVKLRKQLSQGLIMPMSVLPDGTYNEGQDVSKILNVLKYEAPVSASLAGTVKGFFPSFIPKTDEERIQNMLDVLDTDIKEFYISEKIDGCSVTFYKYNNEFGVCSRNLELKEDDKNTMWIWARENDIENKLRDGYAIQGELAGEGINGNPLKIKGHKVFFFNVYDIKKNAYLDFDSFLFGINKELKLDTVPIISMYVDIPRTLDDLLKLADRKSIINDKVDSEGIVIRPMKENYYNNSRFSFKVISNKYLLDEK